MQSKRILSLAALGLIGLLLMAQSATQTVKAVTVCAPDSYELFQTYTSWHGANYIWNAAGPQSGSQLGNVVWNERGTIGTPDSHAIATGTFTLNGVVTPFQLGTNAQPYTWHVTSQVGATKYFYMEGQLSINGVYCTFYKANGVGTWADSVFTTIKPGR